MGIGPAASSERVRVYEDDDRNVSIRAAHIELAAGAFAKDSGAGVTPRYIVDNKVLGAVLTQIRGQQLARESAGRKKARTERQQGPLKKRLSAMGAAS